MSKLEELMQQQAALAEEIKRVAKDEKAEALKEVRRFVQVTWLYAQSAQSSTLLLDVHAKSK